jgi:hypothetical protein
MTNRLAPARRVAIAGLILIGLHTNAESQIAGTLDLQTHCERALAGIKMSGDSFQLPLNGGDAYQCFGFVNAIQQLSRVYREDHALTYLCLPDNSSLIQLVWVVVAYGQRHPQKAERAQYSRVRYQRTRCVVHWRRSQCIA